MADLGPNEEAGGGLHMQAASPEDEREDSPSHQEEDGGHEGIGSQQSVRAKGQALNMPLAAIRKSGAGGQVRGDC